MFFTLSKILGWFINPLHLGLVLIGVAVVLRRLKRRPRVQKWLVIVAVAEMWIFSLRIVSEPLLWGLEHQYPRAPELAAPPRAIVLLTGITRLPRHGGYDLTEAGDRLVETIRLAHQYPDAKVVVSGTFIDDDGSNYSEAATLAGIIEDTGISADRLLVDDVSRNTAENARESKRVMSEAHVDDAEGTLVLVTSAMHMPRAAACFRKAGMEIVPWPVDYRSRGIGIARAIFPGIDDMALSYEALREYVGLLAYKISGYT
jgi:uncharacterized SAM-binding protein YcdF (DUF218 family)